MGNISLDLSRSGIEEHEILSFQDRVNQIRTGFDNADEAYRQVLGWRHSFHDWMEKAGWINELAARIKNQSKVLFVIGIGGSYLGSRSVISALKSNFFNVFAERENELVIFFAGMNLSTDYLYDLLKIGQEKDFSIIVISKSGTTLEPALSFRLFRELLEEKYGEAAKERVYAVTDENSGTLKQVAENQGYEKLPIPTDVGGRYSVLTPVGLLPIAAAGIDIFPLLQGARDIAEELSNTDLHENIAYRYAVVRNILYKRGKSIELLGSYDPKFFYFSEWWKQLFAESEGKDGKGVFPTALNLTTDLHSLGQFIQEGSKIVFETILAVENSQHNIEISHRGDEDGLSYIEGKNLDHINRQALQGTVMAHASGGVPNLIFNIPSLIGYNLGQMIYMFEEACAMSANLLEVNPFDQPGVEHYKKNMFSLLGKPE